MADLEQYQNKLKEEYGQYMGKKLVSDDTNPVPGDVCNLFFFIYFKSLKLFFYAPQLNEYNLNIITIEL